MPRGDLQVPADLYHMVIEYVLNARSRRFGAFPGDVERWTCFSLASSSSREALLDSANAASSSPQNGHELLEIFSDV